MNMFFLETAPPSHLRVWMTAPPPLSEDLDPALKYMAFSLNWVRRGVRRHSNLSPKWNSNYNRCSNQMTYILHVSSLQVELNLSQKTSSSMHILLLMEVFSSSLLNCLKKLPSGFKQVGEFWSVTSYYK